MINSDIRLAKWHLRILPKGSEVLSCDLHGTWQHKDLQKTGPEIYYPLLICID